MYNAARIHIGFFGKVNTGKSSLINALCEQDVSIVSCIPGTTTDAVSKNIEIASIGACTIIDTPGVEDNSVLGEQRASLTNAIISKVDIAVVLSDFENSCLSPSESSLIKEFVNYNTPVVLALSKSDVYTSAELALKVSALKEYLKKNNLKFPVVAVSSTYKLGVDDLITTIANSLNSKDETFDITHSLCNKGDLVVLVMPQDSQAPKGRLIMPQVQTIRNLLDKRCVTVCTTEDCLQGTLESLATSPKLIITDSKVFSLVEQICPKETLLTSFSVLMARIKGDIDEFVKGAKSIEKLTTSSKVLIAESCSHVPDGEDIGRIKIPNLLRKRIGEDLTIVNVSGNDFPDDLTSFDLIIHCGGCMFTRKYMLNRIAKAKANNVPITNYGIAIAWLTGVLDKVVW